MKGINLIIGGPGACRNRMGHTLGFRLDISFIKIVYGYKYIYGSNFVDPNLDSKIIKTKISISRSYFHGLRSSQSIKWIPIGIPISGS